MISPPHLKLAQSLRIGRRPIKWSQRQQHEDVNKELEECVEDGFQHTANH